MKIIFLAIGLLMAVSFNAQAGSLFRWVDKDGNVHYGDRPAEDAVKAEPKKFGSSPVAGDDDLPYGVRKAKQDFPVTLYVGQNCGEYCVNARSLLNKRGIPYIEKMLLTQEDADAFKKLTGGNSIPTLMVGKTALGNFMPDQWNGELDLAGYPKTAPYGFRPAAPAAVTPGVSVPK